AIGAAWRGSARAAQTLGARLRQYLDQSSNVMIEIQSNVSSISLSLHAYGNNGINLLFGSYSAEQTGYFVGTIFTLISAALVAPWYDFPILDRKSSKKGGK
uniref:hypothetical protein n=1 Tax=Metallibacterium scheffleri TaxID=993689 RepID=UPI0023F03F14